MNKQKGFSTKMIAEAGMMIALAKILSYAVLLKMPQGGSITLGSMVPLIVFAIRWGWQKGMVVGAVYGLVDMLIGGYIAYPAQAILDYPLAYAMIGLAGLKISLSSNENDLSNYLFGIILGHILRALSHVASGVIFFGEFAPEGISPLKHSISYNIAYMGPELVISLLIVIIIWKPVMGALKKANL